MIVAGYRVEASPLVTEPERAAAGMLEALSGLEPAVGEAEIRRRLEKGGRYLQWRRSRTAFLLDQSPVGPVHVKIYAPKNAFEVLGDLASPSRGETSWRLGRALVAAGIPTPEPLLLMVRKPFRLHRQSIVVTRPLQAAVLLTDELRALLSGAPRRRLLERVAFLAADLHGAGFFHGDFTASNLLVEGPPENRRLWLIDLDRAKDLRWLPFPMRRRLQRLDLRMLLLTTWSEVSRREWLRFLALYFRRRGIGRGARRRDARIVLSARRGRVRIGANPAAPPGGEPWGDQRRPGPPP